MTREPELIGLAVLGASTLASGAALALRTATTAAGLWLALGGLVTVLATVTGALEHATAARVLVAVGCGTAVPLALALYPRTAGRQPVDLAALLAVGSAGLVAAVAVAVPGRDEPWVVGSVLVLVTTTVLHVWWKLERGDEVERRAVLWMATPLALTGLVYGFVVFAFDGASTGSLTAHATIALCYALMGIVGPAMYIGTWRPETVDVRGLIVGSVVFGTVVVAYLAIYATVQSGYELVAGEPPSVGTMGLVAALAAAGFHPLQVAMRGVIDQLLFGRRPDPLGAAGHVADNIGDDPELALAAIREALVLPYAQLLIDGEVIATSGTTVTHTRSLALALGDDRAGELVVGLRAGDLDLSTGDRHVLDLARPLLAQSLRAQLLADELQESREQTITAIEEERRRLRRDLHDGLGPRLSGIAFTSDAAGNTLRTDPAAAGELLRSVRSETVAAIREVRELVYGMRPPALDELGLVPAIRQQADLLRTPDGRPMRVVVEVGELPALTAALEVATYRISVEALTNAARHSGADGATLSLRATPTALVVQVRDQGAGEGAWVVGVGLSSMRERAAELGGTLDAGREAGHGVVTAELPLA